MESYGKLMEDFRRLWKVIESYGILWKVIERYGIFWKVIECYGKLYPDKTYNHTYLNSTQPEL